MLQARQPILAAEELLEQRLQTWQQANHVEQRLQGQQPDQAGLQVKGLHGQQQLL